MNNEEEKKCPLCAEEMDWTDQQLKPCKCGYQVCVWCWHHIMDMAEKDKAEGRCPACRTPYNKEKIVAMEANCERVVATNKERENKSQKAKPKRNEVKKDLSSVRVIQRKMAYIIGLPLSLADEDLLHQKEYFGQYGKVSKVSLSRTAGGAIQQFINDTCSVYVTYSKEEEAIRCIQSVHGFVLEGRFLRASFGTAKYCHAWLRSMPCTNPSCLYLHSIGAEEDSFGKDEEAAVHTRNRVHQIVGATHNMQQRSGTTLPPPLDGPLNCSIVSTDRAIAKSAQKDTANATVTSNGHLTCHLSSTYQNGCIKTPNKSFVDIVGRCSSGSENGNVAEDGNILNLCSELSSAAIDKGPLVSEYSDAILSKVSSSSHLPIPLPKHKDPDEYSVESFREPSKFSVLGRDDFTSSDACVTKGLSCLMSDTGKRALPGSCIDMREDLSFNDQGLKGSSSFSQGFFMPQSYPIRNSNQFNGHAWQPKEASSLRDLNVGCKTIHHVGEASIPFTSVNSILIDGYNERKFQSPSESDGNFRCSNSFSNDEIVEQLRRLDNDNITNDDDSSASGVVESSIISNILSMDWDSFDDYLTFPHSLAELFDGTDKQRGSWNFQNSDQSSFAFAKEENSVCQAIDFNSSFCNTGPVSKKYSLFSDSTAREEHYLSGPQHHVSRTQSLAPPGFSVSLREPPRGFSTFEGTNQVLSATSGSRLVMRPSNQYFAPSSAGNISNTHDVDLIDPAILVVGGGKSTNAEARSTSTPQPTSFGDEGKLWPSKQQSTYRHRGSIISPTFMQETFVHQEPRFSGQIGDGFSSMGDTLGISLRFMDQQESCNPSPFTQVSQQRYGNGCISNDYWSSGLDEIRVTNEVGMAEISRNERLGSNKLFAGYGDLMLQIPSRGRDVYSTMYEL